MSDIFISYSQKDREVASKLAQELEQLGFTVFYDVEIAAGAVWRDTIMSALQKASVVVVLWSHYSIQSEWVRAEANLALDENKFLPVLISDIEIPLGFSHIQTLDLSHLELNNNAKELLIERDDLEKKFHPKIIPEFKITKLDEIFKVLGELDAKI